MAADWPREELDRPASAEDRRAQRLGELLNEYIDRRQRGESLSAESFAAEHPDIKADLLVELRGLRMLDELGAVSPALDDTQAVARPSRDARPRGGSSGGPLAEAESSHLPTIEGYEVLREIGRGGMGVVYKAIQRSTKRVVAMKVLLAGPYASGAVERRFEREIELAAQLRHANIIPIYDSGRAGGRTFYAMEYVRGRPLDEFVRAGNFSVPQKLRLFLKICAAVSHAHLRGVIHRDLKPANILVDADGEPRVHDFGLAKQGGVLDLKTSMTAQIIGTPAYMAPEQVAGDPAAIDPRADVYALGVILYEMLTGRAPYPVTSNLAETLHNISHAEPVRPTRVEPRLGVELETIVLKALAKQREDRYQSVSALSADVQRFLSGEPIEAQRASTIYLLRKALWPHRYILSAIAAVIVISVLAGMLVLRQSFRARQVELQLAQAKLDAMLHEQEAARKLEEQLRRRDEEWVAGIAQRVQEVSRDGATALMQRAEGLVRGAAPVTPRQFLARLGASTIEAAAEAALRIPASQPTTAPTDAPTTQTVDPPPAP